MFDYVGQCFLHNAEERGLGRGRNGMLLPADLHMHIQRCTLLDVAGVPAQGRGEAQIIEVRRAQVRDEPLEFNE